MNHIEVIKHKQCKNGTFVVARKGQHKRRGRNYTTGRKKRNYTTGKTNLNHKFKAILTLRQF